MNTEGNSRLDSGANQTVRKSGFYSMSKFRLISTIVVAALSIIGLSSWGFSTEIRETSMVNFVMVAVMVIALAFLIIDIFVADSNAEKSTGGGSHGS